MLKKVFNKFDEWITFILFASMFLIVLTQFIDRIFFQSRLLFTEELARFLLMWCTFASLPVVLKKRKELRLTLFTDMLSFKSRKIFDIAINVITVALFAYMVYWGIKCTQFQWTNIMPAMRFSMGLMYVIFPIGMLFGIIRAIQQIIGDYAAFKLGRPLEEGVNQ